MKIGIIGLGSFGAFIAQLCPADAEIVGFDEKTITAPEHVVLASLEEVAKADIIFLAIPLDAYAKTLNTIKDLIHENTLIVDICSVKTAPSNLIHSLLPHHKSLLITHPLFGPQSASQSTKGHVLVVTEVEGERAKQVLRYCKEKLELTIKRITADEHDKHMATVHALTFFVARTLKEVGVQDEIFSTPSYTALLNLAKLDEVHSEELFRTVEQGNPHAHGVYMRYLEEVQKLAEKLNRS